MSTNCVSRLCTTHPRANVSYNRVPPVSFIVSFTRVPLYHAFRYVIPISGVPEALIVGVPLVDIVPIGLTNSYFVEFNRAYTSMTIQVREGFFLLAVVVLTCVIVVLCCR